MGGSGEVCRGKEVHVVMMMAHAPKYALDQEWKST